MKYTEQNKMKLRHGSFEGRCMSRIHWQENNMHRERGNIRSLRIQDTKKEWNREVRDWIAFFLTNEKGGGIIILIYKRIGCQKKRVFGFEGNLFSSFFEGRENEAMRGIKTFSENRSKILGNRCLLTLQKIAKVLD